MFDRRKSPAVLKVLACLMAVSLLGIGAAEAQAPTPAPAPPAAPAAPAAGAPTPESPWMKVCGVDPATNQQACTVQADVRGPNGALIASVRLQPIAQQNRYGLLVLLPLGVYLPPGIGVSIDNARALTAEFSICLPQPATCVAETPVETAFIDQMKRGGQLTFTATSAQRQEMAIPLTLVGFTTAFDGQGINEAEARARLEELNAALQRSADAARQRLIDQQNAIAGAPTPAP